MRGGSLAPVLNAATITTDVSLSIAGAVKQFLDHKREVERRRRKTLAKYQSELDAFVDWCDAHGHTELAHVTVPVFRRYQSHHAKSHEPKTTHCAMTIIKGWAIWL